MTKRSSFKLIIHDKGTKNFAAQIKKGTYEPRKCRLHKPQTPCTRQAATHECTDRGFNFNERCLTTELIDQGNATQVHKARSTWHFPRLTPDTRKLLTRSQPGKRLYNFYSVARSPRTRQLKELRPTSGSTSMSQVTTFRKCTSEIKQSQRCSRQNAFSSMSP